MSNEQLTIANGSVIGKNSISSKIMIWSCNGNTNCRHCKLIHTVGEPQSNIETYDDYDDDVIYCSPVHRSSSGKVYDYKNQIILCS